MPLPTEPSAPWPPKAYAGFHADAAEAAAWYSGDTDQLARQYGGANGQQRGTGVRGLLDRFWGRRAQDSTGSSRQRLHVPLASDVAATSADLLWGEDPAVDWPDDVDDRTREWAEGFAQRIGLANTLLEAAEIAAGIGGVYLRPAWDPTIADHPLLTVVHGDTAVPEFRFGVLSAVTFWRVVREHNGEVWRHLERHEPGVIVHRLFCGDKTTIGTPRGLADHADTASLDVDEDGVNVLPDGINGLLVRYVPNALPNRKRRGGMPIGRSDTAGTESLMDALDEAYTSWMRDIRLGQARIIVPQEFLERRERGGGASFDVDREVFSPLEMDPKSMERAGISDVQFEIRHAEHAATAAALVERIVTSAGYSAATFGLRSAERGDVTATEVTADERMTTRTRDRKRRYWEPAVSDVVGNLLVLAKDLFGADITPVRPMVRSGEAGADPRVVAETGQLLRAAEMASTETLVRMRDPGLGDEAVAAEVAAIMAERSVTVDPFGFDDPAGGVTDDGGEG